MKLRTVGVFQHLSNMPAKFPVRTVSQNDKIVAIDDNGNTFTIKSLVINKYQKPDAVYLPNDKLYQVALSPVTKHEAEIVNFDKKIVNIVFTPKGKY